ncbi:MAG: hypothetical protein NW220_04585 [Leptolyngbyaceae cyanobacterium bins.349]|nr:hypothetical protein [Leptolyngbyaceae cyanobacterium bins.349]
MAGLFKGLFGGKRNNEETDQQSANQPRENGKAYYLEMDDARTYGDLNYMRTSKKVRRTFPKTVNNEEMEMEKEISSMNMSNRDLGTQVPKVSMGSIVTSTPSTSPNSSSNGSANGSVPTDAQVAERRKSDSSLDMFRSMAKDMRK